MDHNAIRHKLSEYIDDALAPDEKAALEEHLETCRQCSDALAELRKTIEHVRRIEEVEPPAWMKQKIMAAVRGEAEKHRSIFDIVSDALLVKFPVKAVAVVFLAVIVLYMYRDISPKKFSETTPAADITASKEAAPAPQAKNIEPGRESSRARQAPQSPEYKALDMKGEYEKPAPPQLADKLASAKPAEERMLAKKEAPEEKRAASPQAAAPVMAENQAAPSMGFAAKAKSPQAAAGASVPARTALYFRDYPVKEIYGGKHARVDLSSHPEAKTWRTKLIEAANKGSNFAGHYTIAQWGCGTSCTAVAVMDAITWKVYLPAALSRVSWAGLPDNAAGLKFRLDSNLLIVQGSPNEEGKTGTYYYVWKNNDLALITSPSQ